MLKPFEKSQGLPPAGRLDALTGLRCYAALFVVLFHISLNRFFLDGGEVVETGQLLLSNAGWFGVTFFFVLSGFVLTWSLRVDDTPRGFLWRRVAKIAPNHLVTFIVAFSIAGFGGAQAWEALSNLLLLHAWVPRDTAFFSINHPSWSLSAELFFYAMFPLLIWPVLKLTRSQLLPTAACLVVAALLLPFAAQLLPVGMTFGENHAQSPLYGSSIPQVWAVYAFPPARLLEFVLGMVCARIVRHALMPRLPLWFGFAAVIIGYAASFAVPTLWQMTAIYILPVSILIVATAQAQDAPAFIASPTAVRLGEISFALYMVHDIVLMAIGTWAGPLSLPFLAALMVILGVIASSFLLAWALWKFIEVPSNSFLRSLSLPSLQKMES